MHAHLKEHFKAFLGDGEHFKNPSKKGHGPRKHGGGILNLHPMVLGCWATLTILDNTRTPTTPVLLYVLDF